MKGLNMNNIISISNVRKTYRDGSGQVVALNKETVDIEEGKMTAVIGPSGSGKSTLLQIIGGLDKPDSGAIVVDGRTISKLKEKELSAYRNQSIGFVFQAFNVQPYLTVQDNVAIPMLVAGLSQKEARARAGSALKRLDIKNQAKKYPNQLSGGQLQRVAIARALVNNPKILLADEPTGNLDEDNAKIVMDIFKKLCDSGITVAIITHDANIAKQANSVIRLKGGKIV